MRAADLVAGSPSWAPSCSPRSPSTGIAETSSEVPVRMAATPPHRPQPSFPSRPRRPTSPSSSSTNSHPSSSSTSNHPNSNPNSSSTNNHPNSSSTPSRCSTPSRPCHSRPTRHRSTTASSRSTCSRNSLTRRARPTKASSVRPQALLPQRCSTQVDTRTRALFLPRPPAAGLQARQKCQYLPTLLELSLGTERLARGVGNWWGSTVVRSSVFSLSGRMIAVRIPVFPCRGLCPGGFISRITNTRTLMMHCMTKQVVSNIYYIL